MCLEYAEFKTLKDHKIKKCSLKCKWLEFWIENMRRTNLLFMKTKNALYEKIFLILICFLFCLPTKQTVCVSSVMCSPQRHECQSKEIFIDFQRMLKVCNTITRFLNIFLFLHFFHFVILNLIRLSLNHFKVLPKIC